MEPVGSTTVRGGARVGRRRHVDAGDASEGGGCDAGGGVDGVDDSCHVPADGDAK